MLTEMDEISFGCIIVTFNPDLDILKKNIQIVKAQVKYCVVVDNGSDDISGLNELLKSENVNLVALHENKGIASAQNSGFQYLSKKGVDWVLTLDQDSIIPSFTIDRYIASGKLYEKNTGIVTAAYCDENWTEDQKNAFINNEVSVSEKNFVISSGNLIRTTAWKLVDGFDESLFIDMVDYDFDAKLVLAGYKIWQSNLVVIEHTVGRAVNKPVIAKLLLIPKTSLLADHSKIRQFYIYRNTLIFYKRYPNFVPKKNIVFRTFLSTRRIFAYENSFIKFMYAWKGIVEGAKYSPTKDKMFVKTINKLKTL